MKAKKFYNLIDAHQRATNGEELAQKSIIGCLNNLGCDHLAEKSKYAPSDEPKWKRYWRGLQEYVSALVCEYGETEAKAEKEVLAELNAAQKYSDDVVLV